MIRTERFFSVQQIILPHRSVPFLIAPRIARIYRHEQAEAKVGAVAECEGAVPRFGEFDFEGGSTGVSSAAIAPPIHLKLQ